MTENAASDGFGSNFSGAAFCLAQPIGGLLVNFNIYSKPIGHQSYPVHSQTQHIPTRPNSTRSGLQTSFRLWGFLAHKTFLSGGQRLVPRRLQRLQIADLSMANLQPEFRNMSCWVRSGRTGDLWVLSLSRHMQYLDSASEPETRGIPENVGLFSLDANTTLAPLECGEREDETFGQSEASRSNVNRVDRHSTLDENICNKQSASAT